MQRVKMRHLVKFLGDRSNHCLLIYLFSKMAAVRHLGFVKHLFVPHMKSTCLPLSLRKIWLKSVPDLMLCELGLNMPIHITLWGFWHLVPK